MSSALAEILCDEDDEFSIDDVISAWKTTDFNSGGTARAKKLPENPAGGIVVGKIGRATPMHKSEAEEIRAYSNSCYSTDCYSTNCYSTNCYSTTCYSTNCYSTDCYSTSCYSTQCSTVLSDCE